MTQKTKIAGFFHLLLVLVSKQSLAYIRKTISKSDLVDEETRTPAHLSTYIKYICRHQFAGCYNAYAFE